MLKHPGRAEEVGAEILFLEPDPKVGAADQMVPKLAESPQSEAQETFAGTAGKDRDAPIAAVGPLHIDSLREHPINV